MSRTHTSRENVFFRAKKIYDRQGLGYFIRSCIRYFIELCFTALPNHFKLWYYKGFRSSDTFIYQGKKYHYLFHTYCTTWENERVAVIPIVWDLVKSFYARGKSILEVGNMTSHVYPIGHDVLDKYEIAEGVINNDVVDFRPPKKYDLIFSILTLGWVGLKEEPSDPKKFLAAIINLKTVLSPGGQIIVVHGMGFNLEMDKAIKNGTLKFNKQFFLKKIKGYTWREVKWDEIKDLEYDHSIPTANGVLIGIIQDTNDKQVSS